jgi:hypothetical protein
VHFNTDFALIDGKVEIATSHGRSGHERPKSG